jgi:DNA-binding GntR family transcriptional regulator
MAKNTVPPRRGDQLVKEIEDRIISGQYAPGMRLDEAALSKEFNISRTPIREALLRLEFSGLIEIRPHRGAFVYELTSEYLREFFEVFAEGEAICARLAAKRLTILDRRELLKTRSDCEHIAKNGISDVGLQQALIFYYVINAATHNTLMENYVNRLANRIRVFSQFCEYRYEDFALSHVYLEQMAIIDAIMAGDGEKAAELIKDHIIRNGNDAIHFLASFLFNNDKGNKTRL